MTRRPGLSLTEVLVALFIMGIGTIAILTLFPLGALNMAQAFRDDRCTQSAAQADAYLRWYVKDKAGRTPNALDNYPPVGEGFYKALSNPNPDPDPKKAVSPYLKSVGTPSYPVVIDPLGYLTRGGSDDYSGNQKGSIFWAGDGVFTDTLPAGTNSSALARRSLRSITLLGTPSTNPKRVNQQPLAIRTCTLLDGFGYDPNSGSPALVSAGGPVDRDLRYNWLWVLQRFGADTEATMTVVVFDKRSPTYVAPGAETVWRPTIAAPEQRQLRFLSSDNGGKVPLVQKGGWLLDATTLCIDRANKNTVYQPATTAPPTPTVEPWVRNAHFYRVAGTADDGTGSFVDIELDTPLRADTGIQTGDPIVTPLNRRFIYLTGVAEVFERDAPLLFTP